jgi:hypothetical protein
MNRLIKPMDIESKGLDDAESGISIHHLIEWSPENEMIIVEWCDIAQCYKWLSTKSHSKYSMMHAWMTIPAITLSTISGTASFAQGSLPIAYQPFAPMVIGTINIFIGILTTIQQYLKISELNEGHRVAAIAWDKFARNIRIELAKAPNERMDASQFLKIGRQEFDRLMETSPSIPPDIIKLFNAVFTGREGSIERKRYDELKKPDICDIIVSANENRHPWYIESLKTNDSNLQLLSISLNQKSEKLKERENCLMEKERESQVKIDKFSEIQLSIQQNEKGHKIKDDTKTVDNYVLSFSQLYGRKPVSDEIVVYFSEILDKEFLATYLLHYTTVMPV